MAEAKWHNIASYIVLFLGYSINSPTMQVTWPLYKRQALLVDIEKALQSPRKVPMKVTASILGKVQAVGQIAPWGAYITFSLADALKKATRSAFSTKRNGWN